MHTDVSLNSRLRNCLQTILELEGVLYKTELGEFLHKEFLVLKEVAYKLETIPVEEKEVKRIEAATDRFLQELRQTFELAALEDLTAQRVLQ